MSADHVAARPVRRAFTHTLGLRLALLFALVSALLFGAIGLYLFHALDREIRWRDDQALMGRVVHMRSLIGDSASIAALKERPQLYENSRNQMLAAYRRTLIAALTLGTLLAFALGWWVSQRGLRPVRALARQALAIDAQHLHVRLHGFDQLQELQALSGALNQMLTRLEAGFTQLSRFSEDLAHEMRTPLANLMGQTQLALQRPRSATEYEHLLASNTEEYERLARMTDNMLFLARAEQLQRDHFRSTSA